MNINMTKLMFWLALTATLLPTLRADKGETDRLADQADAVVVGELLSGQQSGRSLAFVLSVTRTIKGDLTPGATVNVSGSTRLSLTRSLRGHYGIWFLKKTGSQWRLLPVMPGAAALEASCYFPVSKASSPASVSTPSPPVTTSDRIAVELAAAIQSYTDPRQLFNLAYGLLGVRQSALVRDLYRALRAHPDPEIRFIGLTQSFGPDDDLLALAEMANNLDLIPKLHTSGMLVPSICGRRNADPRAIQHLGRIASSSNPNVQKCAAQALAYIHTRETLPILAQLLVSADAVTREYAMRGFSRFVDNLPIPTPHNILDGKDLIPQGPTPYRTPETDKYSLSTRSLGRADQTEYLLFWKSWWASVKDKLMAPGQPAPPVPPPPSQRP